MEHEFAGGSFAAESFDVGMQGDEIGVGGGDSGAHAVAGGVPSGVADELGALAFCGEGVKEFGVGGAGPAEIGVGDSDVFPGGY